MDFKVEYGIPVPAHKRGRPAKYHWAEMKPGGCYVVKVKGGQFASARVSARRFFKKNGWEMTTRELGEFGHIWRTK